MDHIKALYEEEIELKRQQIDELRQRNLRCDETNATLINKIRVLEDILDKANVANKDLNTAFEHIREENLRLQLKSSSQEQQQDHSLALGGGAAKDETKAIEQYATLAQESLTWISERDQMNTRIKFLERECTRYHRDNTTLGKQVRHLLKSLEQERGMIIRHRSEIPEEDLNQVVTAADVINKHLVTFECIEELQQNNQKLLTIVKNLGEEQEEREVQFESEEIKRLNDQLQELQSQLDTIKNDRERVLNALNTIHKERDLFKILLCKTRQVEHMTPDIFQRMVSVACASGPAIADKAEISAEREAHIGDLKEMISKLEKELDRVRAEAENLRLHSEDELKLKNELIGKAHGKIIEETKRADVLNQRNNVLEDNLKALTLEFDELRTRCHKLTFEYEEFKKKNDELTDAKESAEKARGDLDNLLAQEKQLNQEAMVQISQYKEQSQQLGEALERERQRNQEVVSDLNHSKEQNRLTLEWLESERHRNHEAFAQIAEFKEQNQRMIESIEQQRQVHQEQTKSDAEYAEINRVLNLSKAELQQVEDALQQTKADLQKALDDLQMTNQEVLKAQASAFAFQELRNFERLRRLQFVDRARRLQFVKFKDSGAPINKAFVIMKKTKKRLRLSTPPSLDVSKQEEEVQQDVSFQQVEFQDHVDPTQAEEVIVDQVDMHQEEVHDHIDTSQEEIRQEDQIAAATANCPDEQQPQQESQPPQVIKFKRRNFS